MKQTLLDHFNPYVAFKKLWEYHDCVVCNNYKLTEYSVKCLKHKQTDKLAYICSECVEPSHYYQTNAVFLLDRNDDIGILYTVRQVRCNRKDAGIPVLRQVENTTPVCSLQYTVWFHYKDELWKGTYFDNSVIVYARSTMHKAKPLERTNL